MRRMTSILIWVPLENFSNTGEQMGVRAPAQHSIASTNIADLLERVLDKGIVIAGDIKVKLVDIELLTLQIRLIICSVDKAKEIGMDWWVNNPAFNSNASKDISRASQSGFTDFSDSSAEMAEIAERLSRLEAASQKK